MKKILLLLGLTLLLTTSLFAQRAAVMEFKAGVGISQADVDGLSGIFTTYFRPAGYTMVERTQIDRVISEQGFQRSSLTEAQMVRIGEILNLSMIVIGDINVVAGEYNVDVRVVNVESGTIIATDGESFKGSYRDSMKKLAERLAGQVAVKPGQTVQAAPAPKPAAQHKTPFVILGYLKVFPNDIGRFDSEPDSVIRQINSQEQHGYNTWRLPKNEELSLMVANSVVSSSDAYMTSDGHKSGLVRLVTDKGTAQEIAEKVKVLKTRWSNKTSKTMSWNDAVNYCKNLNEGGYSDYRVPNIDELKTFFEDLLKINNYDLKTILAKTQELHEKANRDYSELAKYAKTEQDWNKIDNALKTKIVILYDITWSSSTVSDNADHALYMSFVSGEVNNASKSLNLYVRCIRSGN